MLSSTTANLDRPHKLLKKYPTITDVEQTVNKGEDRKFHSGLLLYYFLLKIRLAQIDSLSYASIKGPWMLWVKKL